jgi:hypothetical protein
MKRKQVCGINGTLSSKLLAQVHIELLTLNVIHPFTRDDLLSQQPKTDAAVNFVPSPD